MSPLLFAAASELMLRRLRTLVPRTVNRSWADDLAMVLSNGFESVPILFGIFSEFSVISGLYINIAKTVLVPLYPADILEFRSELARMTPEWGVRS